jgi:hypothetical protein
MNLTGLNQTEDFALAQDAERRGGFGRQHLNEWVARPLFIEPKASISDAPSLPINTPLIVYRRAKCAAVSPTYGPDSARHRIRLFPYDFHFLLICGGQSRRV